MFDIKSMFAQQHPEVYAKYPRLSAMAIAIARWMWKEKEFQAFAEKNPTEARIELLDKGFEYLDFDFLLNEKDRAKIPKTGRLIVVANHSLGYLDGLGLIKKLREIRPDVKLMLNESLHVMLDMNDYTIPVDNHFGAISKKSLRTIYQHLDNEGLLIIFPAGRVSAISLKGLRDFPWNGSFLRLATQKKVPILPAFVGGRNSTAFYFFSVITRPLSNRILLFRELLQMKLMREMFSRQKHQRLPLVFGDFIHAEELEQQGLSQQGKIDYVRQALYALKK